MRLQGILSVLCLFFAACAAGDRMETVGTRYPDGGVPIRLTVSLPQSAFPEKRTLRQKTRRDGKPDRGDTSCYERNESGYAYLWWKRNSSIERHRRSVSSQTPQYTQSGQTDAGRQLRRCVCRLRAFAGRFRKADKAGAGCSFGESLQVCPCTVRSSFRRTGSDRRTVTVSRCCVRQPGSMWRRTWRRIRGRYGSASAYRANDKIQIAPDEAVDEESFGLLRRRYLPRTMRRRLRSVTTAGEPDPVSIAGIYLFPEPTERPIRRLS